MRNPLHLLAAHVLAPWALFYSDITRELSNVDVLTLSIRDLLDEHDTCLYQLRSAHSMIVRYVFACRLAVIEGEVAARGYTLD